MNDPLWKSIEAFPNVSVEGNYNDLNIGDFEIVRALSRIFEWRNINSSDVKCHIIFSNEYDKDINNIIIKSRKDNYLNEKGSTIPLFGIKDTSKYTKPIIILNVDKLKNSKSSEVESVIVHEMNHLLDFDFTYPIIQKEYDTDYFKEYDEDLCKVKTNILDMFFFTRKCILSIIKRGINMRLFLMIKPIMRHGHYFTNC